MNYLVMSENRISVDDYNRFMAYERYLNVPNLRKILNKDEYKLFLEYERNEPKRRRLEKKKKEDEEIKQKYTLRERRLMKLK